MAHVREQEVAELERQSRKKEVELLGHFLGVLPSGEGADEGGEDGSSPLKQQQETAPPAPEDDSRLQILTICHLFVMLFLVMEKVRRDAASTGEFLDYLLAIVYWRRRHKYSS